MKTTKTATQTIAIKIPIEEILEKFHIKPNPAYKITAGYDMGGTNNLKYIKITEKKPLTIL